MNHILKKSSITPKNFSISKTKPLNPFFFQNYNPQKEKQKAFNGIYSNFNITKKTKFNHNYINHPPKNFQITNSTLRQKLLNEGNIAKINKFLKIDLPKPKNYYLREKPNKGHQTSRLFKRTNSCSKFATFNNNNNLFKEEGFDKKYKLFKYKRRSKNFFEEKNMSTSLDKSRTIRGYWGNESINNKFDYYRNKNEYESFMKEMKSMVDDKIYMWENDFDKLNEKY